MQASSEDLSKRTYVSMTMMIYRTLGLIVGFFFALTLAIFLYFYLSGTATRSPDSSTNLKRPGKIIIDTDAGSDDAGAILLALAAQEHDKSDGFEVIAITCVYGNTNVTNVAKNVLKILTVANRHNIPVYVGAHKPLVFDTTTNYYYGKDGLGDFEFGEEIIAMIDRSKHASVALVDLTREHAGNISVMALGPLTNIALAITLDPNFATNVERFYIMGSSVRGSGNVAPNVEANFREDPESNWIVLNNTKGLPAVLLPWETCLSVEIPMDWRLNVLGAADSRIMKFLNLAERNGFKDPLWVVADIILSGLLLWPELITKSSLTNVTPVIDGAARGSVLVDYANSTGKWQNVLILENFDVKEFKQMLLNKFS